MDIRQNKFLFVIGVHKAGTTSLYEYLIEQPHIFRPMKKELHFFTEYIYNNSPLDYRGYSTYFQNANRNDICLDVSPTYLYGGERLANELKSFTSGKFLVILRDPTVRFYSFYRQSIKRGEINKSMTLREFFDLSKLEWDLGHKTSSYINRALREGCYSSYLKDWFDVHDRKNIKVIFFENLIVNPKVELNALYSWLSLEIPKERTSFDIMNESFTPRNQKLHQFVIKIYSRLESILRKNRSIINMLKPLYLIVNKAVNPKRPSVEDMSFIQEFYSSHNRQLLNLLSDKETKLPAWVKH
ncbi:MAG: sulfotransferase domain-containing protein [Candidatus Marinimicrobia bacterium]|nr:sulfotransferase domain-containing protein [Candidatus Neomarinimicrobiota bacterium]